MESSVERLELSHAFLPVSLIIIVSGYSELILDELGLKRVLYCEADKNALIKLCCNA